MPRIVVAGSENDTSVVNYKLMPVYLLEIVKEQQRMIRELQVEAAELKSPHKK